MEDWKYENGYLEILNASFWKREFKPRKGLPDVRGVMDIDPDSVYCEKLSEALRQNYETSIDKGWVL